MASGLRYDLVGPERSWPVRLPVLDEYSQRGTVFRCAYTVSPASAPARAAWFSGAYPRLFGVTRNGFQTPQPRLPSFVEVMRRHGWTTAAAGQWHLGATPADLGFERAAFYLGHGPTHHRWVVAPNGRTELCPGDVDEWAVEIAVNMWREMGQTGRPRLLYWATQLPAVFEPSLGTPMRSDVVAETSTWPLPPAWDDEWIGRPAYLEHGWHRRRARDLIGGSPERCRTLVAAYAAAARRFDELLGRLLAGVAMARRPCWVVITSTHGFCVGDHGLVGAEVPYEPVLRIPWIVVAPGSGARICDEPVLSVDLHPTLLEAAGLSPDSPVQGRSLLPWLGLKPISSAPTRDTLIMELADAQSGVRPHGVVRWDAWKYIRTDHPWELGWTTSEELYNLARDRIETNNVVIDRRLSGVLGALAGELRKWQCEMEELARRWKSAEPQR
jgi:arylsulfatase A-like enzyme